MAEEQIIHWEDKKGNGMLSKLWNEKTLAHRVNSNKYSPITPGKPNNSQCYRVCACLFLLRWTALSGKVMAYERCSWSMDNSFEHSFRAGGCSGKRTSWSRGRCAFFCTKNSVGSDTRLSASCKRQLVSLMAKNLHAGSDYENRVLVLTFASVSASCV